MSLGFHAQRIGRPSSVLKQNCGHVDKQQHRYENTPRTSTTGARQLNPSSIHRDWCLEQDQSQAFADRRHQALGREGGLLLGDGRYCSHLSENRTEDWFVAVQVKVTEGRR